MLTVAKRLSLLLLLAIVAYFFATKSHATDSHSAVKHSGKYPTYPHVNYGLGARAEMIKHGEYLTKLGDCIACHTEPGGRAFAGGYAVKTPFGTVYSPNITPDKKTGIGNWTNKQFLKAMREGISPSGHYYYPAFPYQFFNRVSTDDLLAIKAYLNAIPSVRKHNRKNDIAFPLNIRFFQIGWRLLFFKSEGAAIYNPKQSKYWNRGRYLVDGLGHCSMCHTPTYYLFSKKLVLAAPIQKYYLTGGFVDGFYALNITSSFLKDTPIKEIENVFLKNRMIGGGQVQGPMRDANHDSLKYLTHEDVHSISTYLKTVVSKMPSRTKIPDDSELGQDVYKKYCMACHTTGAGGAPKIDDAQAWVSRVTDKGLNLLYKHAINGYMTMPPKGTCMSCSNREIQAAVRYMIDVSTRTQPGTR